MKERVCSGLYLNQVLAGLGNVCTNIAGGEPDLHAWSNGYAEMAEALHMVAASRNRDTMIADRFASMDEFWSAVACIDAGKSTGTYWDTYEHGGRRELERELAAGYGAADALLLNSGMSAIAVAVGSCNLRTGAKLLTGGRQYFETTGFLERFVEPTGVDVIRVDCCEPGRLRRAILETQPDVVLLETVTNCPTLDCALDLIDCISEFRDQLFVIDNSVQSWLTRWFELVHNGAENLLVVESGTKYISNEAMCGIIYGSGPAHVKARIFARDTGQQMQGRALNYLHKALIASLNLRLALHARNAKLFRTVLRDGLEDLYHVDTLDSSPSSDSRLFSKGPGCLVFVRPPDGAPFTPAKLHRWAERAGAAGDTVTPQICAGFGWMCTSARTYSGSLLNQPDAPSYLRVSLGAEPANAVRRSAELLVDVLRAA